jgi:nucleotidyltransferase/DNA polymerase involved in DNA repair
MIKLSQVVYLPWFQTVLENLRPIKPAASYKARKFGIHSATPSATAIAKCPPLSLLNRDVMFTEKFLSTSTIYLNATPI